MVQRSIATLVASALLGLAATAANATVNITIGGVAVLNQGQTSIYTGTPGFVTETFESTAINSLPGNYDNVSTNGRVVTGSLGSTYAAPTTPAAPNSSQYLTVPTSLAVVPLSITIDAPGVFNYFGLWWGSVDTYNAISFLRNNNVVASFTGAAIQALPTPALGQGVQSEAVYVNFHLLTDFYDQIVLASSQQAFESDNHVFGVVPVPGSALLMLSGAFGMMYFSRRKKKLAAA